MRKKLKDTGGLTFVELLCAVAILILLCLMMNTGLSMAVKSYRDITAESEAQLLVSSLTDALTDRLRYCVVTEKTAAPPGGTAAYALSIGEVDVKDGKIVVQEKDASGNVISTKQLLPEGAYGAYGPFSAGYIGRYRVGYTKDAAGNEVPIVTFDPITNSFAVKFTVTDEQLKIERKAELIVRCLSPVKIEV